MPGVGLGAASPRWLISKKLVVGGGTTEAVP